MSYKTIPLVLATLISSLSMSTALIAENPELTETVSKPVTPKALMKQLGETKVSLDTWHKRVLDKQAFLKEVLDESGFTETDLQQLKAEADSKQAMSVLVELLDEEAESLETAYEALSPNLVHYQRANHDAPATYTLYSKRWDDFAHEAKDPSMKELYANWADTARRMAKSYVTRGKEVDNYIESIDEKMQLVSDSREFFEQVLGFIEVMPSDIGLEIAQFDQRLDLYIKTFRDAADDMRSVHDRLASPSKSKGTKSDSSAPDESQVSSRSSRIDKMLVSVSPSPNSK